MMRDCMNFRRGPYRAVRIAMAAIVGVIMAALIALVFGVLVKALWNWVMPPVFGLGTVTYWQAFGLLVLGKLLFGSVRGSSGRGFGGRRERMRMEAEHWGPANWHQFREYWQTEGRSAFDAYLDRRASERSGDPTHL